jgi:hypothetical protein
MEEKFYETKTIRKDGALHHLYKTEKDSGWKYHNFEGPAIEPIDKNSKFKKEYYLYGIKYSMASFYEMVKDRDGVPFHKTALFKQANNRA